MRKPEPGSESSLGRFDEMMADAVRAVVEDAENFLLEDEDIDDVVLKVRMLCEQRAKLGGQGPLEDFILQAGQPRYSPAWPAVCD